MPLARASGSICLTRFPRHLAVALAGVLGATLPAAALEVSASVGLGQGVSASADVSIGHAAGVSADASVGAGSLAGADVSVGTGGGLGANLSASVGGIAGAVAPGVPVAPGGPAKIGVPVAGTSIKPALRCGGGNLTAYNGYPVRYGDGGVIGWVKAITVSEKLAIQDVRFAGVDGACYRVIGGTVAVTGREVVLR